MQEEDDDDGENAMDLAAIMDLDGQKRDFFPPLFFPVFLLFLPFLFFFLSKGKKGEKRKILQRKDALSITRRRYSTNSQNQTTTETPD